jgi:DUF1707 SHOCT-like domain
MTSIVFGFYALCLMGILLGMFGGVVYACAQAVRAGVAAATWLRREPTPPDSDRRAGDRDRLRALGVLRHGYAEGRLELAELETRAGDALAARTTGELGLVVRDLPQSAPVRLRSHELAAGLLLLLFSSNPIRVLGVCLIASAFLCDRLRPVPIAFAAGILVAVSLPAALVLAALLAWERAPFRFPPGPVLRS